MPTLRQLVTPTHIVRHVSDITPRFLRERGIRAVVTDLDNTIAGWHSDVTEPEVIQWLTDLTTADIGICIASNTRRLDRLTRIATEHKIKHVPGNSGKPGIGGLKKALDLLGVTAEQAVMVGDQVFTDILAGNRLGMTTILVNPLSSHEFIGTRLINRTAERFVLRGSLRRPE